MQQQSHALDHETLPATFRFADSSSLRGRRLMRALVGWELASLIAAATAGVMSWQVGRKDLDVIAGTGALAFASALLAMYLRALKKPDRSWFAGRAAAESVKTLAWRYAAQGNPLPGELPSEQAQSLFLDRIKAVFDELMSLQVSPSIVSGSEISEAMNRIRGESFETRRRIYCEGRLQAQIAWYRLRAEQHQTRHRAFAAAAALSSLAGVTMGTLRFLGFIEADLMGIFAAIVSSSLAWSQLNQHRTNFASYTVAAHEISLILERAASVTEKDWATFVSDSEGAISREHTMWLARHGRTT